MGSWSSRTRRALPGVIVAIAVLVLAGCGSGIGGDSSGPTTLDPQTAEKVEAATTPTVPPAKGNDRITALIRSIEGERLVVDRVQVLTGRAAQKAFREDYGRTLEGAEQYVRDTDSATEDLTLGPRARFKVIRLSSCCDPKPVSRRAFPGFVDGSADDVYDPAAPFVIQLRNGRVVSVEQVYVA